jgi:hypothetical protein
MSSTAAASASSSPRAAQRRLLQQFAPEHHRPLRHGPFQRLRPEARHRAGQRRIPDPRFAGLEFGEHRGTAFDAPEEGGQRSGRGERCERGGRVGHRGG